LSNIALIFTLKSRDPERFDRKQMQLAVGGDADAPPISVTAQENSVRLYLPHNHRDPPATAIEVAPPLRTTEIEGRTEPTADELKPDAEQPTDLKMDGWSWQKIS
jgi:hypothetical protein